MSAPQRHSAADIFNSAVAATAIGAAWELGALAELDTRRTLDVEEFAARNDLDFTATTAMFTALASVGVVERASGTITPGPGFAEVYRAKPMFYWLCQGSWSLFARMPALLRNENRSGDFYERDARAISFASREANRVFFDPLFWRALNSGDTAGGPFSVAVDLGSGSGERLIRIAERYPGVRGIGLDIAEASVGMAEEEAGRRGLADRIGFRTVDVRALEPEPEFAEVDLLLCFMMGHDLWPRDNCVAALRRLREAFPNVRRFLLGDTVRTTNVPDDKIPVFTLGFEVGHALMGVYLPTVDEWLKVFADGGWRCVATYESDALAGTVVFELD